MNDDTIVFENDFQRDPDPSLESIRAAFEGWHDGKDHTCLLSFSDWHFCQASGDAASGFDIESCLSQTTGLIEHPHANTVNEVRDFVLKFGEDLLPEESRRGSSSKPALPPDRPLVSILLIVVPTAIGIAIAVANRKSNVQLGAKSFIVGIGTGVFLSTAFAAWRGVIGFKRPYKSKFHNENTVFRQQEPVLFWTCVTLMAIWGLAFAIVPLIR